MGWNNNYYNTRYTNGIKTFIYRYSILVDGKFKENNLLGWRTALAHARRYITNLFEKPKKIEILNIWTGEIINLEDAEKRAAQTLKKARH